MWPRIVLQLWTRPGGPQIRSCSKCARFTCSTGLGLPIQSLSRRVRTPSHLDGFGSSKKRSHFQSMCAHPIELGTVLGVPRSVLFKVSKGAKTRTLQAPPATRQPRPWALFKPVKKWTIVDLGGQPTALNHLLIYSQVERNTSLLQRRLPTSRALMVKSPTSTQSPTIGAAEVDGNHMIQE